MAHQPSDGAVTVGVNGSDKDHPAVDWAANEAWLSKSNLHVLHILPAPPPNRVPGPDSAQFAADMEAAGQEITQAAARRARSQHTGLTVTTETVTEKQPTSALVRAAERASVLVLGARRPGRIADHLLRPISEQVAARTHSPVVIIRNLPPETDAPVVAGVDLREATAAVLEFAFAHAARHGLTVRVVHAQPPRQRLNVFSTKRFLDSGVEQDAIDVENLAASWSDRYPGVPVDVRESPHRPIETLVQEATCASLVALGSRTSSTATTGPHLGQVTRQVLHQALVVAVTKATTNS